MVRAGIVSSVNPATCTARVAFPDMTNMVSYELPVLVRGAAANKDYWLPAPGEQVVCVFMPNGNVQGFILGSIYSEKDKPPVADSNKRNVTFSDGMSIEYDSATHSLSIDAKGPIHIVGNVTVVGDVIAEGISLKSHIHSDVMAGPANTGPPVGGG